MCLFILFHREERKSQAEHRPKSFFHFSVTVKQRENFDQRARILFAHFIDSALTQCGEEQS